MSLFVGIEAVGLRQCAVVASDSEGTVHFATRRIGEPMILHSTDRGLLRRRLFNALKDIASGSGVSLDDMSQAVVCIGLAGAAFPSEMADLRDEFSRLEIRVGGLICSADTDAVLVSHLRQDTGSVIVCGSGAAVLVAKRGLCTRSGGWGPAISERGSGYWIGRQAISAIAREWFRGSAYSLLWNEVSAWLREQSASAYPDVRLLGIRWLEYLERHALAAPSAGDIRPLFLAFINQTSVEHHHPWRCLVSNLSQPVMSASLKGDASSIDILHRAIEHLVRQYMETCELANEGRPVNPIVMYGGVLSHNMWFREKLQERLSDRSQSNLEFVTTATSGTLRPAYGALLLALGRSQERMLRLPKRSVIDRVLKCAIAENELTREMKND